MGEETREALSDTRDQVANFLEEIHKSMTVMEGVKILRCLRATRIADGRLPRRPLP